MANLHYISTLNASFFVVIQNVIDLKLNLMLILAEFVQTGGYVANGYQLDKGLSQRFGFSLQQRQVNHIAMITFWSQFSVYVFNTVLILFLTRAVMRHGLGFSEAKAYAFIGITQAANYLMPMLGGHMADNVLGIRRSILIGSILLASAYLLIMLSGFTISNYGDILFIASYALVPVTNSLLVGTASSLVSQIYAKDSAKAKAGMTLYYMSINVGALLATLIAPKLLDSRYGPLSVFAVVFIGKSIAALNFASRYKLYDNVVKNLDTQAISLNRIKKLIAYVIFFYAITLIAYLYPDHASYLVAGGCSLGIIWFISKTMTLRGAVRTKQLIGSLLILEAILFFVIYTQMNSTLVLCAKNNSDLTLLGMHLSPAHFQIINPLMIIGLGLLLPKFYQKFKNFNIPYQFASGTLISGIALLVMWHGANVAENGLISGNYIGLTYVLITLSELWVSAIGLSMIGLYCAPQMLAFAMGAWYLSNSLSYVISGQLAKFVAIPDGGISTIESLNRYQNFYFSLGLTVSCIGLLMFVIAKAINLFLNKKGIKVD